MATNFFFNNFQNSQEQLLIENLVIESIKIYGHDVKYVQRTLRNRDGLYGEDAQTSRYSTALDVEMYIKDVDGFKGDGEFLSKFNLEIRDSITFTLAKRTFFDEVGNILSLDRPREGDLVFFPLNQKCFEIKYVEQESIFYQMGSLQMFDLKCDLFEYNGELFETGEPDIDALYTTYNLALPVSTFISTGGFDEFSLAAEDGSYLITEGVDSVADIDPAADNATIEAEADNFLDFSETNPFSEGRF